MSREPVPKWERDSDPQGRCFLCFLPVQRRGCLYDENYSVRGVYIYPPTKCQFKIVNWIVNVTHSCYPHWILFYCPSSFLYFICKCCFIFVFKISECCVLILYMHSITWRYFLKVSKLFKAVRRLILRQSPDWFREITHQDHPTQGHQIRVEITSNSRANFKADATFKPVLSCSTYVRSSQMVAKASLHGL